MFNFFKKAPAPKAPAKTFHPPKEFEYNLHLALELMSCDCRGDLSCMIEAANGTVILRINGIQALSSLTLKYTPGAHKLFFGHPTYSDGRLQMTFREPDCYIFGCERAGMQFDLDQHAPNARIGAWYEKPGVRQTYIEFAPYPWEEETARWKSFESYYNIWCK